MRSCASGEGEDIYIYVCVWVCVRAVSSALCDTLSSSLSRSLASAHLVNLKADQRVAAHCHHVRAHNGLRLDDELVREQAETVLRHVAAFEVNALLDEVQVDAAEEAVDFRAGH